MSNESSPSRLQHLDESSCRQLLATHDLGRVAINAEPSPEIFPVTYRVADGDVLFRTAGGVKQLAAQRGSRATFEVDGVDADRHSAWSIVVRGRLEEALEAENAEWPEPFVGGERPYLIRLRVQEISGRRVPPEHGWARAMTGRSWSGKDASDLMG